MAATSFSRVLSSRYSAFSRFSRDIGTARCFSSSLLPSASGANAPDHTQLWKVGHFPPSIGSVSSFNGVSVKQPVLYDTMSMLKGVHMSPEEKLVAYASPSDVFSTEEVLEDVLQADSVVKKRKKKMNKHKHKKRLRANRMKTKKR